MGNEFNDSQNWTSRWGDDVPNLQPESPNVPGGSDFSSFERLQLSEAPDILRKSIERFLMGNVV